MGYGSATHCSSVWSKSVDQSVTGGLDIVGPASRCWGMAPSKQTTGRVSPPIAQRGLGSGLGRFASFDEPVPCGVVREGDDRPGPLLAGAAERFDAVVAVFEDQVAVLVGGDHRGGL